MGKPSAQEGIGSISPPRFEEELGQSIPRRVRGITDPGRLIRVLTRDHAARPNQLDHCPQRSVWIRDVNQHRTFVGEVKRSLWEVVSNNIPFHDGDGLKPMGTGKGFSEGSVLGVLLRADYAA